VSDEGSKPKKVKVKILFKTHHYLLNQKSRHMNHEVEFWQNATARVQPTKIMVVVIN